MTRMEWQEILSAQFGKLGILMKQLGAENRNFFIPSYEELVPKILDLVLDIHLADNADSLSKFVTAADDEHRVAAEVRTSFNSIAIQRTLKLFSEQGLDKRYDRLVILVLTLDRRVIQDDFNKQFFNPHEDLWNLQTLFERVSALEDVEKAEHISRYLDQMLAVSFERPRHLLPSPPPGTDTFVGREPELCKLRRMLCRQKHIVISGIGGIGKTEVALRLAKMYSPPKGAYFILYGGRRNKKEHHVIRDLILNTKFTGYHYSGWDNDTREQEYAERLEILKNEYRDALLIIDNFDLSQKGMHDAFQEAEYLDLVNTGAYLVFTTRYDYKNSLDINRLDSDTLLYFMKLLLNGVQEDTDEDLLELIAAVDGHTYTVELMARSMVQGWGHTRARDFLEAFKELKQFDEWYPDVSTIRNGIFESRDIYEHLSKVFELSDLSEIDQCILRYATLLPVNGMERELFLNAVTDCEPDKFRNEDETGKDNIFNSITARAWLRREQNILTIHPVIRNICCRQLKPDYSNCEGFLDALWNKYNTQDYDEESFRQLAELFAMAAQLIDDLEGICSLRSGLFWHRLGKPKKALCCYKETVRRQEESASNTVDLVRTYNKIGSAHIDLGKWQKAHDNFLKAMDIAEKNPDGDQIVLATTYDNLGKTYAELGNYEMALYYRKKALDIREKVLHADHPFLAASYSNVGSTYFDLGIYRTALEYNLKALEIREKTSSSDDNLNLATSYNNVGGIYMRLNEYKKALDYLRKALNIRKLILPSMHPSLATSYNNVGGIYMRLNDYQKALDYLQKALDIREQVLAPDHSDIAETCTNIAMTYYAMKQYEDALKYINRAISIAESALSAEHPNQDIYRAAKDAILSELYS